MSAITYAQAKHLTLARLNDMKARYPRVEWDRPMFVIANQAVSLNSLIAHVTMDDAIGRAYVYQTASYLGYIISG